MTMERIIALSETSPQMCEIDSDRFCYVYAEKTYKDSLQDNYLRKTNEEKTHMINEYYNYMVKGKLFLFVTWI